MSEHFFCHYCQTYHPKTLGVRFLTRCGYRWRCRRSLDAARASVSERDAFGLEQTEFNRKHARFVALRKDLPISAQRFLR